LEMVWLEKPAVGDVLLTVLDCKSAAPLIFQSQKCCKNSLIFL
jgi:hypothetical protein